MSLPWVRLDANIASHDKIVALLAQQNGAKAFVLYVSAMGWAGGHGTDGFVPRHVLPLIHGTERTATMLRDVGLFDDAPGGWTIHNYLHRQELATVTETKRAAASMAGRKSQCLQRHGADCGCWENAS